MTRMTIIPAAACMAAAAGLALAATLAGPPAPTRATTTSTGPALRGTLLYGGRAPIVVYGLPRDARHAYTCTIRHGRVARWYCKPSAPIFPN